jgi:glucose-6-phosphate 1-dehydrogenase
VRSVNMDFTYGLSFARDAPEAYETLLLDAMLGDASLFTRADEVEAAWGIVTPMHDVWDQWDKDSGPDSEICFYEAGSWGPKAADELMEHDGRRWRRL